MVRAAQPQTFVVHYYARKPAILVFLHHINEIQQRLNIAGFPKWRMYCGCITLISQHLTPMLIIHTSYAD